MNADNIESTNILTVLYPWLRLSKYGETSIGVVVVVEVVVPENIKSKLEATFEKKGGALRVNC